MKRFIRLFACLAMVLSLTGCGFVFLPDENVEPLPDVEPAEHFEIHSPEGDVLLTQEDLERADAVWQLSAEGEDKRLVVQLTFNETGTKKLTNITTVYIGQELPILLDGEEVMRPAVNARITGGMIILSGEEIDTYEKAAELAARIASTIK